MPFLPKRLTVLSAEIKEETTYGTENAPAAAADAFYLQYDQDEMAELVAEEFEYDGDLGPNAVGYAPNQMVAPSGRSGKVPLSCYFRGAGVAQSALIFPKNRFHLAMKTAGYVPTGSFVALAEKYTYNPAGPEVTPVTATEYFWSKQLLGESKMERVKLLAALASLKVECSNPRPPRFIFETVGIFNEIADATFTAPTLASTPLPPLGSNLTFAYGAFAAAEVYSFNFNQNRQLSTARVPLTGSGVHLGFVPGKRRPTLDVVIQQTKFADWNAYDIRNLAGTAALALTNGSTQHNIIELLGPQAQLRDVKQTNRGNIPQWTLQFLLTPSTPAANDDHAWVAR